MLFYLLERAAIALRDNGLNARTVEVRIRYADGPGNARARTLPKPTDRELDFVEPARALLDALHTRRVRLKLIGVTLSGLIERREHQKDLFTEREFRRRTRLTEGIDRIRERFGFAAITAGRSIHLLGRYEQNEHGFVLKTPSLTR